MAKRFRNIRKVRKSLLNVWGLLLDEFEEMLREEERKERREWVGSWIGRRETYGPSATLLKELMYEDPREYTLAMRMPPQAFGQLLELVSPLIRRQDTIMRDAISPRIMLEVTMDYLATGSNFRTLQHKYRVSKAAISNFIPEVCDAIYACLQDFIKVPSNHEEWKTIAQGFEQTWNFPMCCGAMDGKHIEIQAPPSSGSEYFNYKGAHSVVLMAVVDHNYCFRYFNVGAKGSNSDGGVFQHSQVAAALEAGLLPDGYFIVGDDAFPLKTYLLKPYTRYRVPLTKEEIIFNYRLSRARRIVENAFGKKVVAAACSHHNWLGLTFFAAYFPQGSTDYENKTREILPADWRSSTRIALFRKEHGDINAVGKKHEG